MSEKIKLTGHLGRGIHQLKLLAKVDGSPSTTYKIETDLEYNIFYGNSLIGNNITPIEAIRLAGGPYLKVGSMCEDVPAAAGMAFSLIHRWRVPSWESR